jgi:Fur family transcriptional regulator, ferric uptake regulator
MHRHTKQRAAIQAVMEQAHHPLLPQEILQASQASVPNLNLATVYRNLNALVDEGLITTVHLPNQATRFERCGHHHHHFVCQACEKVFDIHECSDVFNRMVPQGFQVQRHELTLYGQCPTCSSTPHAAQHIC